MPASGTPSVRVPLRTRVYEFPYRPRANRVVRLDRRGKRKLLEIDDPGGVGLQVTQEVILCPGCAVRKRPHHGVP